jgi:hypothetical protein
VSAGKEGTGKLSQATVVKLVAWSWGRIDKSHKEPVAYLGEISGFYHDELPSDINV